MRHVDQALDEALSRAPGPAPGLVAAEPKYERLGRGYAQLRRTDPRVAAQIVDALGAGESVLNVGAGTGSYEPSDRAVVALEPALRMIAQRVSQTGTSQAGTAQAGVVRGVAERLPFRDGSFDAAMAIMTLHHWTDWRRGIEELRRVARGRVVLFTFDAFASEPFWLFDYFPQILQLDRRRFPPIETLVEALGEALVEAGDVRVEVAPLPADCIDGSLCAYWRRPEAYLDARIRSATSGFAEQPQHELEPGLRRLADDIASGAWASKYAWLLERESLDVGFRLIVAEGCEAPR